MLAVTDLKSCNQCFWSDVGVPSQHSKILMSSDAGNLHNVQTLFKESACGFVTQIVKAQVLDVVTPASPIECLGDAVWLHPPHLAINPPGKRSQRFYCLFR